jgi:excisionase family DNA binding protein
VITEDDMDKLLLTPTEAASALGIGRSKVYELLKSGQLQSVHIGACRRVPADALTAFLEQLSQLRFSTDAIRGGPDPGRTA